MAGIQSGFFNSQNDDRPYDAEDMNAIIGGHLLDGIFPMEGSNTPFLVGLSNSEGTQIAVLQGMAWIHGHWVNFGYDEPTIKLDLSSPDATNPRIDLVVIRLDEKNRNSSIVVKTGTPAATPTRPTVTYGPDIFELPIAYQEVDNAGGIIHQPTMLIGTNECPYVMSTIDPKDLTERFDAHVKYADTRFEGLRVGKATVELTITCSNEYVPIPSLTVNGMTDKDGNPVTIGPHNKVVGLVEVNKDVTISIQDLYGDLTFSQVTINLGAGDFSKQEIRMNSLASRQCFGSRSIKFTENVRSMRYSMVGGGGGGASGNPSGTSGGGGAGDVYNSGSVTITPEKEYSIVIGSGGSGSNNGSGSTGGTTTFNGHMAYGGKGGGHAAGVRAKTGGAAPVAASGKDHLNGNSSSLGSAMTEYGNRAPAGGGAGGYLYWDKALSSSSPSSGYGGSGQGYGGNGGTANSYSADSGKAGMSRGSGGGGGGYTYVMDQSGLNPIEVRSNGGMGANGMIAFKFTLRMQF